MAAAEGVVALFGPDGSLFAELTGKLGRIGVQGDQGSVGWREKRPPIPVVRPGTAVGWPLPASKPSGRGPGGFKFEFPTEIAGVAERNLPCGLALNCQAINIGNPEWGAPLMT